jgi:prolyl-tRNA synthetase
VSFEKRQLPKKSVDLSDWYNRVVMLAELADYGPAKGTMIFRPYGYAIWEEIVKFMDGEIKKMGVENAYFPLLIPESLLKKEKEHVEGFAPELAVVTIGGGEDLGEKLVVRPTSETSMYSSFSNWIKSWRDLPVRLNQWNNVVRWEKRTYLFLRTSEFLWQEGHTAHATHEEAVKMQEAAMNLYERVYRELLAVPGYVGHKSATERFAGAADSMTLESLMPEGKALQSCTSHDLGQNFSQVFNIRFQDKEGKNQWVWQTSWGLSTRSIGGMLMAHGDDAGLRLPPMIAPVQVVVLPVKDDTKIVEYAGRITKELEEAGVRVKMDDREGESLGFRINKWELKGVPVRIEIGDREVTEDKVTMVRRDTGEKIQFSISNFQSIINDLMIKIQNQLLREQEEFLQKNTHEVADYGLFKKVMESERGFIKAFWCESRECESKIKEETKATTRCLPVGIDEEGKCIKCGQPAKHRWLFALAY